MTGSPSARASGRQTGGCSGRGRERLGPLVVGARLCTPAALIGQLPGGFGILRSGRRTWPSFLEWERRVVRRPGTMAARRAHYLCYCSPSSPSTTRGAAHRPHRLRRPAGGGPVSWCARSKDGRGPGSGRSPLAGTVDGPLCLSNTNELTIIVLREHLQTQGPTWRWNRDQKYREMAIRGKYQRLHTHLCALQAAEWRTSFSEIESTSVRATAVRTAYRPWWAK